MFDTLKNTLFSVPGIIIGIALVIVGAIYMIKQHLRKKLEVLAKTLQKRKHTPAAKVDPTATAAAAATEGFQTAGATASTAPTYTACSDTINGESRDFCVPQPDKYLGPFRPTGQADSTNFDDVAAGAGRAFVATPLDAAYDAYEQAEYEAQEAINAASPELEPVKETIPDYGSSLSPGDVDITNIPWDSDNKDQLPSDILWGFVTKQASKSLFLKVYSRTVLSDPAAIQDLDPNNDASPPAYRSPILPISTQDEYGTMGLMAAEGLVGAVGQFFNPINMVQSKLTKLWGEKMEDVAKKNAEQIATKLAKFNKRIGQKAGSGASKKLSKNIFGKLKNKMLQKISITAIKSRIRTILMNIFTKSTIAALTTASVLSFGAASPALAIFIAVTIVIDIALFAVDAILMAAPIFMPPILEKYLEGEGICPDGSKTIYELIPDRTAYFIFTMFVPLADIMDLLGPYVCWDGADVKLKTRLFTPSYYEDKTLSLAYHDYAKEIQGEDKRYGSDIREGDEKMDGNRKLIYSNGFFREICAPGTQATSNEDRMCNKITKPVEDNMAPQLKTCDVMRDEFSRRDNVTYTNLWKDDTTTGNCFEDYTQGSTKCSLVASDTFDGETGGFTKIVCTGDSRGCGCVRATKQQRASCPDGYELDNNDFRCYKSCGPGFTRRGMQCFSNTNSYIRRFESPSSDYQTINPGYQAPRLLGGLTGNEEIRYCNFASPVMLDRMAQFYYDQSYLHPDIVQLDVETLPGGNTDKNRAIIDLSGGATLVQWDYISRFYGVIASSELSCDVACEIRRMTYNPVTGASYSEDIGCVNETNPEDDKCKRRFYFTRLDSDPQGIFTVTGCTNSDGTAPEADVNSWDDGVEYVPSLPKVFQQKSSPNPVTWTKNDMIRAGVQVLGNTTALVGGMVIAKKGGTKTTRQNKDGSTSTTRQASFGSTAGAAVFSVGAGLLTQKIVEKLPQDPATETGSKFLTDTKLNDEDTDDIYYVMKRDNYVDASNKPATLEINFGPIYEQAIGFVPRITRCSKAIISPDQCAHKYVLRDTIAQYERENPKKRVKQVDLIEPRGKDGCFYRWKEVNYDPNTNQEDNNFANKSIIYKYKINNQKTCVFDPDRIIYDFDDTTYPLRTMKFNTVEGSYTSRKKITKPVRKIRIEGGTNFLQISQIVVYNTDYVNVAKGKVPTSNTTAPYVENGVAAVATNATDGVDMARAMPNIYCSERPNNAVFEIDLGKEHSIHSISIYNRNDSYATRWNGYKVNCYDAAGALNYTFPLDGGTDKPNYVNTFSEFPAVDLERRNPLNSFQVPLAMPPQTTLGGAACPAARCENLDQAELLMKDFNDAPENVSRKIMKITKAWTPRVDRCDYEVEMMRVDPAGKKTFQVETLYMNVAARDGSPPCTFKRTGDGSDVVNSGTYIQSNTPPFTYRGIGDTTITGRMAYEKVTNTVTNAFGTISQALQQKKPLETLKARAIDADNATKAALSYVAANQTLQGCPTKCSDPSVLTTIFNQYNAENAQLKEQFGASRSLMNRIVKAGGAGPTECDILFEEQAESYDDALYPPTTSEKKLRSMRVKMTNTGNCKWTVAPAAAGSSSFKDVSGDAVGLLADTSQLAGAGFTIPACQVDCRAPANLKAVQAAVNAAATGGNITTNFRQVTQSFRNGASVCEYAMMKDVTTRDPYTRTSTTDTDLETYVTATFTRDAGATCKHTLSRAVEFYPDALEERVNRATGDIEYYLGEKLMTPPLLFSYDSTTPSALVNAAAQNM